MSALGSVSDRFIRASRRVWAVARRVLEGCYRDGTIHAGNLAYMSMLAIFPFFITGAAVFSLFGEQGERAAAISALLTAMPPSVGAVIEPVARDVVEQREGWLLWLGGAVGLWTAGSLIDTVRDILRRAYGTQPTRTFWIYRIISTGIILGAVIMLNLSLFAQVAIGAAQEVMAAWFPGFSSEQASLGWSRIVPGIGVFVSIYFLLAALTPTAYRSRRYPKWPGAVLVTGWWIGVTIALPPVLARMISYDLTYGSLAGIMIALFFFWLVGLGIVAGAELNAALALLPPDGGDGAMTEGNEQ